MPKTPGKNEVAARMKSKVIMNESIQLSRYPQEAPLKQFACKKYKNFLAFVSFRGCIAE